MDEAKIAALFAPWDRPDSPGVVWAATRGGAEIASGAVGMSDIAQGVRLDRRSVIRIGSQTKQFTVLLALMLEADGKLSMNDEVHRHCPWLPPYPAPITLQHLATNTSGLRDFLEMMVIGGSPLAGPATRARQQEIIGRHAAVNFPPGEQMIYCNTGFWLLSEIIEQVSGQSFDELLEARITGPLGMADTRLLPLDAQIMPRLSAMHTRGPDGEWLTARWGWAIGGEGGMVSTLDDMLLWQANFADPKVGSAALFARMATPVTYSNGTRGLYAMGLGENVYRGQRMVGHGGSVAGGRSESVRLPELGGGIVILANLAEIDPFSLARRVADIAFADALAPPVGAGPASLAGMAGLYRQENGAELLELLDADGTVALRAGMGRMLLDEVEPGLFVPERTTLNLTLRPDADALAANWCGTPRRYRKVAPDQGDAADLAGRYGSAATGLAATIRGLRMVIGSEHGLLRLRLRWVEADLLAGVAEEAPADGNWWCTMRVVEGGLVVTTERIKQLALQRIA